MTEIKRYVPANDDRGEGTVVRNDNSGTVVFYDDHAAIVAAKDERIAALQEQVRALAAENAALKNANSIANNILNDEETMVTSLWASSVQNVQFSTPATDAAIREIRAQALESLADDSEPAWLESYLLELRNRAASIRAGEQP